MLLGEGKRVFIYGRFGLQGCAVCLLSLHRPREAYLASLEKIAALPVKKVFPAHHSLEIQPDILIRMREALRRLKAEGKLHHGSGAFDYGDWGIRL